MYERDPGICRDLLLSFIIKHMKKSKKKIIIYGIVAVLLIGWLSLIFFGEPVGRELSLKQQFIEATEDGVDPSNSGFPPEETAQVIDDINIKINLVLAKSEVTAADLISLAQSVVLIRDRDLAFDLYDIIDQTGTTDFGYLVRKGNLYLESKEWEQARLVLEPLKISWPRRETYLGLARAYENLEGTPDYVVDDIYEEALVRSFRHFSVLGAYASWLQRSGRFEKALPLYEEMNKDTPQESLTNTIAELKEKISNNK